MLPLEIDLHMSITKTFDSADMLDVSETSVLFFRLSLRTNQSLEIDSEMCALTSALKGFQPSTVIVSICVPVPYWYKILLMVM